MSSSTISSMCDSKWHHKLTLQTIKHEPKQANIFHYQIISYYYLRVVLLFTCCVWRKDSFIESFKMPLHCQWNLFWCNFVQLESFMKSSQLLGCQSHANGILIVILYSFNLNKKSSQLLGYHCIANGIFCDVGLHNWNLLWCHHNFKVFISLQMEYLCHSIVNTIQ